MADEHRLVRIPQGMKTPRYTAPREVAINGEVPLIDRKDPKSKQIQLRLIPHIRVFNLSDANDLAEYEQVWQAVIDGKAKVSEKTGPNWDEAQKRYVVCLRWSDVTFKLPES